MSKDEKTRETERLEQCNKSFCRIKENNFDPDRTLEELKALTLRWYLYGKGDGLDFNNESLTRDFDLD
jgi:hypothetical protein